MVLTGHAARLKGKRAFGPTLTNGVRVFKSGIQGQAAERRKCTWTFRCEM
jgi:hypothetical protein